MTFEQVQSLQKELQVIVEGTIHELMSTTVEDEKRYLISLSIRLQNEINNLGKIAENIATSAKVSDAPTNSKATPKSRQKE